MKTIQPLITHEKSRWGSGGKVKDQTKNDMRVTSTKRKALKLYGNRRSRRYEPQSHCGASHRTVLAYYCHAIAVCRNCLVPSLGYSSFKSSQVNGISSKTCVPLCQSVDPDTDWMSNSNPVSFLNGACVCRLLASTAVLMSFGKINNSGRDSSH